ncbi:MAG: hypothetical protein C0478_04610 [Planctomyces sp.]|nr:hypothetical protein [Planctomyces sp.]
MMESFSLPSEQDFVPHPNDLDAACAWRNFGGLTIDEAKAKFRDRPEIHQEDFTFMGGKAFAYYFPVIEDYLKSNADDEYDDDHHAWILAMGIQNQSAPHNVVHVRHLSERILELSQYVRGNIDRFGENDAERQRVAEAWADLTRMIQVDNLANPPQGGPN